MSPPDLPPAYDEARVASTWARIADRRWPIAHVPRRWWLLVAPLALAGAIAFLVWPHTRAEALSSRDHDVAPGAVLTEGGVILDDDSTISLAAGARLAILANDGTRFATQLETGGVHFDVHPNGPRRWEIETALATVEVLGTAFGVELRDDQLTVTVDRGVVLVRGERVPGRVERLTAGQHIVVAPRLVAPASIAPVPAPLAPVSIPAPPPPVASRHPAIASQPPAPAIVAPVTTSVAEIVANADALAGAGDAAGAAALLESVRHTEQASGLVAFTLGKLYLDALDKPELAAAAFDDMIAFGSPHGLLEDAYARRVEALMRAGHRDRALAAFASYEQAYPHGRRLVALRALVGAP